MGAKVLKTLHSINRQLFCYNCGLASYVLICSAVMFFMISCDLPLDPGPQPTTIIETEFVPGLNVLGILRTETGQSYVRVERAYLTEEEEEEFNPVISDALVRISNSAEPGLVDTFYFETNPLWGDVYVIRDFHLRRVFNIISKCSLIIFQSPEPQPQYRR